ncbi:hypothetical protein JCM11957_13960 [Caminibacter profundus]
MKKILIVEDDELNRIVIKEMINILFPKIKIDIASNGKEALEQLEKNSYNLIISDINMPIINGIELLKKLKQKINIPVIAITAYAIVGDKEKLLMQGFDDYISKPVDMNQLSKILEKYIKEEQ